MTSSVGKYTFPVFILSQQSENRNLKAPRICWRRLLEAAFEFLGEVAGWCAVLVEKGGVFFSKKQ